MAQIQLQNFIGRFHIEVPAWVPILISRANIGMGTSFKGARIWCQLRSISAC